MFASARKTVSESNKVTLVWISRHQGILDNEETGGLAKQGAIAVPPDQTTVIPFSIGKKKVIKRYLGLKHQARWTACNSCHQSKTLMITFCKIELMNSLQ